MTHTRPYLFDQYRDEDGGQPTRLQQIDTTGSGSADSGPMIVGDWTVEEVRASWDSRPLHKRELVDTENIVSHGPTPLRLHRRTGLS